MKSEKLSKFLKEHREKSGLTQSELADKLGYTNAQFVSNWERGLSAPPPKTISELVQILDLNQNALMKIILDDQKEFWQKQLQSKSKRMG